MSNSFRINDIEIVVKYKNDGKDYQSTIVTDSLTWEVENDYGEIIPEDTISVYTTPQRHVLSFVPKEHVEFKMNDTVKGVSYTAEVEAESASIEGLEAARKRAGAPKDARLKIEQGIHDAVFVGPSSGPVRVRFYWEE